MIVEIPFLKSFEDVLLFGQKTWTSRTRKYGNPNDVFVAFGSLFTIEKVFKMSLGDIASFHFNEEGFESRQDFINIWRKIHYRKGFDPSQMVWVHQFRKTSESASRGKKPC